MTNKLWPTALLSSTGAVLGGVIWLVIYDLNHTSIEFDGPAGGILVMSVFAGWLLFSVIALARNKTQKLLPQRILTALACGVIVGGLTLFALGSIGMARYGHNPLEENFQCDNGTVPGICK